MEKLITYLFAAYFFISSGILVCVASLICLITAPFDPRRRANQFFSCCWGYHYIKLFFRCRIEGRELIEDDKTYVMVANHQSLIDILAIYGIFKQFKWVSKVEILRMPFVGLNMMLNQYVLIERGDLKSIKQMMREGRDKLQRGMSLMIFPEGTRSPDGEIKSFRDGSFKLSLDCQCPIVPIVVDGTHEILGKRSNLIHLWKPIQIKVLPPVSPSDFGGNPRKMRDFVANLMIQTLAEMRQKRSPEKVHSSR